MPPPDPGWYPDPQGGSSARWWDGTQWTSATQSVATLRASHASKPRRQIDDNFGRLALVVQLMLVVNIAVAVATIRGDVFIVEVGDQFIEGVPDIDDATTADRILRVSGLGMLFVLLLTSVVFIRWLFVAHSSNRVNPEWVKHKSGWAIGGWFVPVLSFWRPFGVTIDVRRGVDGPNELANAVMWLWWLTFLTFQFMLNVSFDAWDGLDGNEDLEAYGEALQTAARVDMTANVLAIIAAALALVVVRQLTRLLREAPVVS